MLRSGLACIFNTKNSTLLTSSLLVSSSAILLSKVSIFNPAARPLSTATDTPSALSVNTNMSTRKPIEAIPPQEAPTWSHFTPELIVSETERLIHEATEVDNALASFLDAATIDNALEPYAQCENAQAFPVNQLTFLQHVSASKEIRDASNYSDERFRAFSIESGLREDVYKVINQLYLAYKDAKDLDPETLRYLEKANKQFERNGLGKDQATKDKIKELKQKLAMSSLRFSKNLGEETEFVAYTKEELNGVPEEVINQFEIMEDGKYKMTFKYPDLFPVLKYATNPETRKRAFIGDQNKVPENANILIEATLARAELAKLLDYDNFSAYILDERMAKTPEIVMNFLEDLKQKLRPLGEKNVEKLKELKLKDLKAHNLPTDDENAKNYYTWDHRYYHTMMLENEYQVDERKISEYFPMQSTIDKMLAIFETIFKLQIDEVPKEKVQGWHEDVKQFAVWKLDDPENPEFVGWLYFDLHPREGKYGHAANFGIAPGYIKPDGTRSYPVTALVCNFSKPTESKPSLLKHDEVTTFFHELGHGIHDLLGKTRYSKFSGTSVSWDFVECPSQMLEYWTWSENELKNLSQHYLDPSVQLPDNLIQALVKSKNVNAAMFNLRQLHFGLFDMILHTSKTGKDEDIDIMAKWNDLREEIALVSNGGVPTKGFGSFGHLFGGYASGYYGYMWSQVFAADIYYTKFKKNPMSVESGLEYRDIILARGGSCDEMDNLKELLGREPNSDAFLQELGLN